MLPGRDLRQSAPVFYGHVGMADDDAPPAEEPDPAQEEELIRNGLARRLPTFPAPGARHFTSVTTCEQIPKLAVGCVIIVRVVQRMPFSSSCE